jgi:prepilin-type N-terminal cleavage/methylation domain-containing protein
MNHTADTSGEATVTAGTSPRRRPRREGFTLTEIMIALGVLVTGMSMVAAALHAGIQNHTTTVDDIIRNIVAENGLATMKARLVHTPDATNKLTDVPQIIEDWTSASPAAQAVLGPQDRRSPAFGGGNGTWYGYCAIGWRASTGYKNDYRFCILPYKIVPEGTAPKAPDDYKKEYGEIAFPATTVTAGDTPPVVGTPTVTKLTLTSNADKLKFGQGAVVIYLWAGTSGKVSTATVAAPPVGFVVTLNKQLPKEDGTGGITGDVKAKIMTITVKDALGATDVKAAISLLKPYQCRTSLVPR